MQNKTILTKTTVALFVMALFIVPRASYADWGDHHDRDYHDSGHFYRWHDHPHYGLHIHFLPVGYFTVRVGLHRYYYYDGLYYNYAGGEYIIVNPPMGAYVSAIPSDFQPVIINGRTYYTDNGVYYILTRHHGYKVVVAPVVYAQPAPIVVTRPVTAVTIATQDTFPVNVPNNRGGYVAVVIRRSGNGYLGPQGEFYPAFPKVVQLKVMYGR